MSYVALYRAWRPQRFAEVVGQEHVVTTLLHALQMHRVAHAYLFAGPRGTGKTSLAKILAKAVNCEHPQGVEPCNVCQACQGITSGAVMDVVEMDAASNRGIDEIRSLLEQVRYAPTEVQKKVYIIDEVHMLTSEAFNALLKTLEEPPDYCLFVLATTELHKVPPTVASRCQRFSFGRVKTERVVDRLREVAFTLPVTIEDAALWLIARLTEGGLRDALSLLDQVLAFSDDHIGVEQVAEVTGGVAGEKIGQLCSCVFARDHAGVLSLLSSFWEQGVDPVQLIIEVMAYLRDAILQRCGEGSVETLDRAQYDPTFAVVIARAKPETLLTFAERMGIVQAELRFQSQSRLYVEVSLLSVVDYLQVHGQHDQHAGYMRSEELQELQQELQRIVKRIEMLERKQGAEQQDASRTHPPDEPRHSARLEDGEQVRKTEEAPLRRFAKPQSPSSSVHRSQQGRGENSWRGQRMNDADQKLLASVERKWQTLLEETKKKSIQTRAWLLAGRPVALFGTQLIIAFKSSLHAETVLKNPHRELIEEVLQKQVQHPFAISTLLEEEWERLKSQVETGDLEHPIVKVREPWVDKVIELLGEDRVHLVDGE